MASFDFDTTPEILWKAVDQRCEEQKLRKVPQSEGWYRLFKPDEGRINETITRIRIKPRDDFGSRMDIEVSASMLSTSLAFIYALVSVGLWGGVLYWNYTYGFHKAGLFIALMLLCVYMTITSLWRLLVYGFYVASTSRETVAVLTKLDGPGFVPRQQTPMGGFSYLLIRLAVLLVMVVFVGLMVRISIILGIVAFTVGGIQVVSLILPKRFTDRWRYTLYYLTMNWTGMNTGVFAYALILLVFFYLALGLAVTGKPETVDRAILDGIFTEHAIVKNPITAEQLATYTVRRLPSSERESYVRYSWGLTGILLLTLLPWFNGLLSLVTTHKAVVSRRAERKRRAFQYPDADRLPWHEKAALALAVVPLAIMNWLSTVLAISCLCYLLDIGWQPLPVLERAIDFYRILLEATGWIGSLLWGLSVIVMFILMLAPLLTVFWVVYRCITSFFAFIGFKWNRCPLPARLLHAQGQMAEALARHGAVPPKVCCIRDDRPLIYAEPAFNRQGCRIVVSTAAASVLPAKPLVAVLLHEACHAARHTRIEGSLRLFSLLGLFPNWALLMFYDFQANETEADEFAVDCLGEGDSLVSGILLLPRYESMHQDGQLEGLTGWKRLWYHFLASIHSAVLGIYGASYADPVARITRIRERSATLPMAMPEHQIGESNE